MLLRYTQALITQMAQTAVCNRHHSVDQQLCRWLLLSLDRLASDELTMTQELIANMLGVRREGVTEAAGKLQKLGVIRYMPAGRSRCSTGRSWKNCVASVMPWSRRRLIGYSLLRAHAHRLHIARESVGEPAAAAGYSAASSGIPPSSAPC